MFVEIFNVSKVEGSMEGSLSPVTQCDLVTYIGKDTGFVRFRLFDFFGFFDFSEFVTFRLGLRQNELFNFSDFFFSFSNVSESQNQFFELSTFRLFALPTDIFIFESGTRFS